MSNKKNDAVIGAIYCGANLSIHDNYSISLDAFEAFLNSAGYKVVPLTPTEEMAKEFLDEMSGKYPTCNSVYSRLLSVA